MAVVRHRIGQVTGVGVWDTGARVRHRIARVTGVWDTGARVGHWN